MTPNTGARWAPDPCGRHELRYWDGAAWTPHVMDEYIPGRDELPPPRPRDEVAPLLPTWGHLMVGVVTGGLWFVVAPVVYWLRRRAVKPAVVWSVLMVAMLGAGIALSSGAGDRPADVALTSPAAAPRALVAATTKAPTATTTTARRRKPRRTTTTRVTTSVTTRTAKARRTTAAPDEASSVDPDYHSCARAKAAGKGPYYAGVDVEYGWYEDADGDGVACE